MPRDMTQTPEQEVLAPGEGMIQVAGVVDSLHRNSPVAREMPAGVSVQDIVAAVQSKAQWRKFIRVYINGHVIPRENWRTARPKPGTRIDLACPQQGPVAVAVASVVVAIAAAAAPSAVFTTAFLATTIGMVAGAALSAAISIAGALAINALIPPPSIGQDSVDRPDTSVERLPGVQGSRNFVRKYQPIPVVLGRHFITPALGAEPYTEIAGDDEYLRQVFVVGLGPLEITDIKIGEDPITNFEGIDLETRSGTASDAPLGLYPGVVFQEGLNIELEGAGPWSTRTTAKDIDELSVDLTFPNGLFALSDVGSTLAVAVTYAAEFREVGTSTWLPWFQRDVRTVRKRTWRLSERLTVARGQYEIRVRRETSEIESISGQETLVWTALRGIRNESPIASSVPLALIAVRIKATNQLSGAIERLSCIATSVAPDYDAASGTWISRATRNPASLYRLALQGPMSKRPTADSRIDLEGLADWHAANATNSRFCDAVLSEQQDLHQVLSSIASTGRASFDIRDGKYSVVRDIPQTVPAQLLTPRNLISLSGERAFTQIPDALRVEFLSEAANWQNDEIIVYNDGKNASNAEIFDRLPTWGVTGAAQAWRDGRYNLAVAKLRPERLTARMSWESLRLSRGYMTEVAHDVMLVGLAQGRVLSVTTDGGGDITGVRLDEPCVMESGETYAIKIRRRETNIARQVVTVVGETQDLTLAEPAPAGSIEPDDLVAFGLSERVTSEWIVKEIERDADYEATLTLIPHAPEIHDADTGPIGDYDPITTLPVEMRKPSPPTIVQIQSGPEVLERLPDGGTQPRIIVTLSAVAGASEPSIDRIVVQVRNLAGDINEGEWTQDAVTMEGQSRAIIREVREGERYDIRAQAISTSGQRSEWRIVSAHLVVGSSARPSDVTGLSVDIIDDKAQLSWEPIPDGDLAYYQVRFSPDTQGATWGSAVDLVRRVGRPATSVDVPALVGTYLVKAVDLGGRVSAVAAAVVSTIARVRGLNFVEETVENPGFDGTKVATRVWDSLGGLGLDTVDDFYDRADFYDPIDFYLGAEQHTTGTYTTDAIDLQAVFTSRVSGRIAISGVDFNDDFYGPLDFYDREDFYGAVTERVGVDLEVRTTDADPAAGEWRDWKRFVVGDHTARAFQFRAVLRADDIGLSPIISELQFEIDMPDRVISGRETVPSGGGRVTFDGAFYVDPDVGLSIQDGQGGDRYAKTTDAEGFDIEFFNSGGTSVERQIEWIARAYGERE